MEGKIIFHGVSSMNSNFYETVAQYATSETLVQLFLLGRGWTVKNKGKGIPRAYYSIAC